MGKIHGGLYGSVAAAAFGSAPYGFSSCIPCCVEAEAILHADRDPSIAGLVLDSPLSGST